MWILNFLESAEFDWSKGTWSRFYIKQKLNWGGAAEPLDSHHIYFVQQLGNQEPELSPKYVRQSINYKKLIIYY